MKESAQAFWGALFFRIRFPISAVKSCYLVNIFSYVEPRCCAYLLHFENVCNVKRKLYVWDITSKKMEVITTDNHGKLCIYILK